MKKTETNRYNETHHDFVELTGPDRKDYRPVGYFLDRILQNCGYDDSYDRSSTVSFKTGFADLDSLLWGGFRPGSLNILAASQAMGKTSLALNIAQFGGGESGAPVLIFSLELSDEQIVQRMLASQAGISLDSMNSGTMTRDDWDALTNAADILTRKPIFIDESSTLTTVDFRSRCHQFNDVHPNLGLIVVDYIQLITGEGQAGDRKHEILEVLRALKETAVELDCPILAISLLPRKAGRGSSMYSNLYDTTEESLEPFSDLVMFLRLDNCFEATLSLENKTRVTKMKHNSRRIVEVPLIFNNEILRFRDKKGREIVQKKSTVQKSQIIKI